MNKCPNRQEIENLLEMNLDNSKMADLLSHLEHCERCRRIVSEIMDDEMLFIESIISASETSVITNRVYNVCLPIEVITAYANESLIDSHIKIVESHLAKCDTCLLSLIKIKKAMSSVSDLNFSIESLADEKTAQNVQNKEGIIEIAIKIKEGFIELIRHKGDLILPTPQLTLVRGSDVDKQSKISILGNFQENDISVNMSLTKEPDTVGISLTVSVMRISNEDFISDLKVNIISSDKAIFDATTNKEGTAEFRNIKRGKYNIMIEQQEVAVIEIQ